MPLSSSAFCTFQHGCPFTLAQMLGQRWSFTAMSPSSSIDVLRTIISLRVRLRTLERHRSYPQSYELDALGPLGSARTARR